MPEFLESMGGNAVSSLINGGINYMFNSASQKKAYALNEKSAENALKRKEYFYNQYESPEAMLRQIQEAGLSPSMMFGKGSGTSGATSAPQGAGVGALGVSADPLSIAQTELLKAQANKAQAEADRLNGKNEYGNAEIKQMLADAGQKEAATAYTNAMKTGQDISNTINDLSTIDQINHLRWSAYTAEQEWLKAIEGAQQAKLQTQFDRETYVDRVRQVKENANLIAQKILESQAATSLTKEQQTLVKKQVEKLNWEILDNFQFEKDKWKDIKAQFEKEISTMVENCDKIVAGSKQNAIVGAIGSVISSMVSATIGGGFGLLKGLLPKEHTPNKVGEEVTTYDKHGNVKQSTSRNIFYE